MNRMEHSGTQNSWVTRRGWKADPDNREFRKSLQGAVEKTRKKWKTRLREELELEDALDSLAQTRE